MKKLILIMLLVFFVTVPVATFALHRQTRSLSRQGSGLVHGNVTLLLQHMV